MFAPKTSLSWIHSARALLCLFILCLSSALSSSLKLHLRNFWTHLNLLNFSPIHPHPSPSLKLHPHPFTLTDSSSPSPILTDSPSPILKSFWVWVKIFFAKSQNKAPLVLGDSTLLVLVLTVTHREKSNQNQNQSNILGGFWSMYSSFCVCVSFLSL